MIIPPEISALVDELERRAKVATRGKWRVRDSVHGNKYKYVQFDQGPKETAMYTSSELTPEDARHICAADPTNILQITTWIRSLEK